MKLSIVNFCSVTNKQTQLEAFLFSNDIDILVGTESHLDDTISNSEILPNNFCTYRKDRNSNGGGVFISVKNTIPSFEIDTDTTIEIVWTYLNVGKSSDMIVGSFYCPPHSPDTTLEELRSSLVYIKQKYPNAFVILGGDFNCPGVDWHHGTLTESYVSRHFRQQLLTLSQDAHMSQLVTFPTRAQNTLDLLFTTHPDSILSCYPAPGLSDHDAVLATIKTPNCRAKKPPRTIYLYKSADWDTIKEDLCNLSHTFFELNNQSPQSLEENWTFFIQNLQQIVNDNTPTKTSTTKTHLPWMTSTLKRLIRKKQRVYNRARRYHRDTDWSEYKSLQKEVNFKLKHQHKSYVTNLISSTNNKKSLWHYLKGRKQENNGIGALIHPQSGHVITDPIEKATVLNNQFKSVFTADDDSTTIPNKGPSTHPSLPAFEITEQGVFNILSNCDPSKSPGPDSVNPYVLKKTAAEISPMLTHIFKKSLETGTVPSQWKHAYISPIFKKGQKSDPKNYRPISLTSVICKSMEHIIVSQVMKHLEDRNILTDRQFGFRSKHSCESQLYVTINDIAKQIDSDLQVDAAILDFSKAFDKVSHQKLLYKLNYYGIRGNVLYWLESFLNGRTQQVVVEGSKSPTCNVTSGVPQGSVLGPVLFLIYINDIVSNIQSEIRLFADDVFLYKAIKTPRDHQILQDDLNSLVKWSTDWTMNFNISKCKILQITTHHNKSTFTYKMSSIPLATVLEHNYLGIRLHHKLSWDPHINYICNKANRLLGFMKRNLRNSPLEIKEHVYKQLLLPSIEYCSSIWDPYHQTSINRLEMIQHRAARFVLNRPWHRSNQNHDSITEMLTYLKWPSLQSRRTVARLTLLYKIVKKLIAIPENGLPLLTPVPSTRAQHSLKLMQLQSRVDIHKYSFLPRTIIEWNALQIPDINEIDLETFKYTISNVICDCNGY